MLRYIDGGHRYTESPSPKRCIQNLPENRRPKAAETLASRKSNCRIQILLIMNTDKCSVATLFKEVPMKRAALEEVAARAGWQIVAVYEDAGISGAKGRDQRPEFDRLLKDATRRRFDVVMAWAIDRLGRSLQHLIACLGDLHAARIDLYLHQQEIDTTTDTGRFFFQMLGAFAEFERSMIRSRVQAGIDRAKADGKRLGRPSTDMKVAAAIRASLAAGVSIRKAAAQHKVGISTVQRVKGTTAAPL